MLSKLSVRKPYTVLVAVVLVIVLGILSFSNMSTDLMPDMEFPYAIVMTTYPGASPEEIETAVTKPVEQAMASITNMKQVSSVSNSNMSVVILEFNENTDMNSATAVNQIETHVFQQQNEARKYLQKSDTKVMSCGPFAEGKNDYFNTPALVEIGNKYGKSSAQVALRFLLQKDVILIPKSVHKNRMEENFNIFDFSLNEEEMKKIEALDTGKSLFFSHHDPATVEWFMSIV